MSFLNNIMVGILALMTVIGLILRTKTAYDAFSGGGMSQGLDSTVVTEIATLVLGLVGVYFAPPLLNLIGNTATVYISGQYDFNFVGAILKIVLSVIPTILMIGVMGLVVGPVDGHQRGEGHRQAGSGRHRSPLRTPPDGLLSTQGFQRGGGPSAAAHHQTDVAPNDDI